MSHLVLDNPLDLLVYCDRVNYDRRATRAGTTPPRSRHEYRPIDAVHYWANFAPPHTGQMHVCAPGLDVDDGNGQSNSVAERQEQDVSHFLQENTFWLASSPGCDNGT